MSISNSLGDIYAVGVDGSALRKLTPEGRVDGFPTLSPDGREIAFTSIRSAHVNPAFGGLRTVLSVMHVDGSRFRTFAQRLYQPSELAWSPDGRHLAFASYARGGHYVVDLATGHVRRLNLGGEPVSLAWSRQGRLAYADVAGRTPMTVVVGPDGKRLWRRRGSFAGWSPDGSKLAIVAHGTRTIEIRDQGGRPVMSFRGGSPGWTSLPWAPNSDALAFVRGNPPALWAATLPTRRLHQIAASFEGVPRWSPGGRTLAYLVPRAGTVVSAVGRPRPRPVPQSVNMVPLAWVTARRLLVAEYPDGAARMRFEIVAVAGGSPSTLASFPRGSQVTAQLTSDRRTVVIFRAYR